MNVLSLFDGISCAQVAINRIGIRKYKYYASEIDKYAIKITQKNFPDTIQLGDVKEIKSNDLPKIDLLIAGSPCQGFSFAGKQLNFNDPRSALFFEFVRLLKELNPKYFILENVKMKKEYQDVITKEVGFSPIEINSSLVSAQNRKRLYWTNISGIKQPKDKGIVLKDILEINPDNIVTLSEGTTKRFIKYKVPFVDEDTKKSRCLSAMEYVKNGRQGNYVIVHNLYGGFKEKRCRTFEEKSPTIRTASGGGHIPSVYNGTAEEIKKIPLEQVRKLVRKLTPIECERLQTLEDNYTEGVSNTQRYKSLGNGFTVDVIAHILKGMKD